MTYRKTRIALLGGLGNQLFQLAALLSVESIQYQLDCSFESVRRTRNIEDLFYFKMPNHSTRSDDLKKYPLLKKAYNFSLRMQLRRIHPILKKLLNAGLIVLNNFFSMQSYALQVSSNLGYVPILKSRKKSLILHGYFQSYRYLKNPRVLGQMKNLRLVDEPAEVLEYRKLSLELKPLVIHIRRGDYRVEDNFGLLGSKYYENALELIWRDDEFKEIWLFSDEPEVALSLIPAQFRNLVRVIPDLDGVPATTLEIMRLGYGFVIANSSFSWWGASLSQNSDAKVVAPSKWFKGMDDPSDLISPEWLRVQPDF